MTIPPGEEKGPVDRWREEKVPLGETFEHNKKQAPRATFIWAGGMGGQPWRLGGLLLAASVAVAALVGSFSLPVRGSPVPRPGRRTHALRNTRTKTMARAP